MKRKISLLLILVMVIGVIGGCSAKGSDVTTKEPQDVVVNDTDVKVEESNVSTVAIISSETTESYITDDKSGLYINVKDAGIAISNGNVVIPETVKFEGNTYTVGSISIRCFEKNDEIVSVTLPDSITRIEEKAFYQCHNLQSVTFGSGLVLIGDYAFAGCGKLNNVVLPDTLTDLREYCFAGCESLESINLENCGVSKIYEGAFRGCIKLSSVTLPKELKTIETWVFSEAIITELGVPDTVSKIGDWAFNDINDITLKVSAGSKAEEYAKENNIKYVLK